MQSLMITCKYGQAVDYNNFKEWGQVVGCDNLLIFGQVAPVIFQKYGQVVLLCVTGSPHWDI